MVPTDAEKAQRQVDWKGELKRRLDQRAGKNTADTSESENESTSEPPQESAPKIKLEPPQSSDESESGKKIESESELKEEEVDSPPTLFKYKLDRALRSSASTRKAEPPSKSLKNQHVFEEPLVRRKPVRPVQQPPGQRTLHLKPDVPIARRVEDEPELEVVEEEEPKVSKEILFSRFLSGIVDLVLPLLMGFTFTIVASFLLGFDLLTPSSIKWIGLFALSFFFFNSVFFFMTSGQTPGMIVTDLRLVRENEDDEVSVGAILLRVLLFLPSALTVIGLAWAIFDPMCRCLHDLLSRTRIEPVSE